jgi:imidazoleglycerol phosphate synthase glutamine amidotransferase subunit HisH
MNSSALILPGVGSFPEGMKNLKKNSLDLIIKNFFKKENQY